MKTAIYLPKNACIVFLGLIAFISCTSDSEVLTSEVMDSEVDEPSEESIQESNPPIEIESFLKVGDFDLPGQDADGFTIVKPTSNSQIVYVDSETGDDDTAEVYVSNDLVIGDDVLKPIGEIKPFATLEKANENMREAEPDMMLLAAGGVWYESLDVSIGKSNDERSIYAAYGDGPRPEIRTGAERGIQGLRISNTIISGIKFWAHTRDDEGPFFSGYEGKTGFFLLSNDDQAISNVLVEDCVFRSYTGNAVQVGGIPPSGQPIHKVVFRRNLISRQYSTNSHSQGIFYNGLGVTAGPSLLLEENMFDHNGWRVQRYATTEGMVADEGQATFFNHNTYFANPKGVLFYGNIFMRPASMNNKWTANEGEGSASDVAMVDNLYLEGEIGIGIGGNDPGPRRFKNILISNNVMLDIGKGRPTNRDLGWCVEVVDWDGGVIKKNLFLHQRSDELKGIYAMNFSAQTAIQNVLVEDNIIYGLKGSENVQSGLLRFAGEGTVGNIQVNNNFFANSANTALVSYDQQEGYSFSNNNYSSTRNDEWFGVGSSFTSFDGWKADIEPDAEMLDSSIWPDPERDIDSYMSSTGKGTTGNDFIQLLYLQSKSNWDASLTAPYVNRWIREGYGR